MPKAKNDGIDLEYIAVGTGPALLLVHGAGTNAAAWWQQVEHFRHTHRVIAYDHRVFGRSAAPQEHLDVSRLAADAVAVMDAAGVTSATVVGHSMGGWTAIRMALEFPERVNRVVLSCSQAGIDHAPASEAVASSRSRMGPTGPASLALSEAAMAANPAKAYLYEQIGFFNTGVDPATILKPLFAPEAMIPVARLAEIACPVLMLTGELDAIWSPASLEGLVAAFPNGRFAVIPNAGHSPYFEAPDAYNAVIQRFLAS